jgi:hypothetical protein
MGPQIPVGVNPQKSFTNRREDGCLRDRVGVEIVQLHPIKVQNRPHETACRHSEPPLVERDKTQHIPRRQGWGGTVAEPPELFQLKCPSLTLRGSNTLKSE